MSVEPGCRNEDSVIRRFSPHVFLSYLLCSFVFTYPLVLRLTTHVPGPEIGGDLPVFIWNLWWMKQALAEGISPLYCDYIFAPYGVSLVFHTSVLFKALLAAPLQWFCSTWTAYNILVLATFALAGWAMFQLALHLTGDRRGAWIAGLIYAFSPYMLTRGLGHLHCLSSEWIPLYVLCLIRLWETRRQRWAWGGGLCLLATAYSDYYYLTYLFLFTALYLAWRCHGDRAAAMNRAFLAQFALMGIIATVGLTPILWNLLASAQDSYLYGGLSASAKFGADLLAFVTPPPGSLLYGNMGAEHYQTFTGGNPTEGTVFAGYVVLGLMAICLLCLRGDQAVRPWLWLTLAFFLLSLGPLLHIDGDFVFGIGDWRFAVPLPYAAVPYLPLIKGARVAARFDIMVMLGLAVLAAFGVRYWLKRVPRPSLWTAGIALLVAMEYLRVPYPVVPVNIPPVYAEIASDRRDVSVMEVPLGWRTSWGNSGRCLDEQQLFQIVHGKRLLGGHVSRTTLDQLQRMTTLPGIGHLLSLQEELPKPFSRTAARRPFIRAQLQELLPHLPDFLRQRILGDESVRRFLAGRSADPPNSGMSPPLERLQDLVQATSLGYVLVHPPYSGYTSIRRYLEGGLPLMKFYERDGLIGYKVMDPKQPPPAVRATPTAPPPEGPPGRPP